VYLAILARSVAVLAALLHFRPYPGIWMIGVLIFVDSVVAWIAQFLPVPDRRQRSAFIDFGRSFLNRQAPSPQYFRGWKWLPPGYKTEGIPELPEYRDAAFRVPARAFADFK
jgi:hypothetical protein